jgi:hypothetical protein
MRLRVTYANVTSTLALFFAMGGASYAAANLPPDSVGTAQLKPHSVGTTQLKNNSVGTTQLQSHSVGTTQLQDRSVGSTQLQPLSVGTTQLKSNSVGSDQLAPASVRIDKLAADSVGSAQIQPNAVTSYQIAPGAVTAREVEQGSLLYSDFAADEVSPRIFGEVNADGTPGPSSGDVETSRATTGVYGLKFDHDITGCVVVASVNQGKGPLVAYPQLTGGRDMLVFVTQAQTDTPADAAFSFVLEC